MYFIVVERLGDDGTIIGEDFSIVTKEEVIGTDPFEEYLYHLARKLGYKDENVLDYIDDIFYTKSYYIPNIPDLDKSLGIFKDY